MCHFIVSRYRALYVFDQKCAHSRIWKKKLALECSMKLCRAVASKWAFPAIQIVLPVYRYFSFGLSLFDASLESCNKIQSNRGNCCFELRLTCVDCVIAQLHHK